VYEPIMAIFGQTPLGIHLGLLLANAATCYLLFLIGRRLLGVGQARYEIVGIADLVSPDRTYYVWDQEAASYQPTSKVPVYLLRRKGNQARSASLMRAGVIGNCSRRIPTAS
jgi:hypothetical protein